MQEFENKTVLVTGATGLIGYNLVKRLLEIKSVKVIATGRSIDRLNTAFASLNSDNRIKVLAFDISNKFELVEPIDYIFHAAGPMEGKVIQNTPIDVIQPNINGTINCLELLKDNEIKFKKRGRLILFSSVTVYSNITECDLEVKEDNTNIAECLSKPSSCYSESKRMSEVIAYSYIRQFESDVVIARLSTVYGDTIFHPDTAFFQFIKNGINREPIIMNTSGIGRRDNIYIDDAVQGLMIIAAKGCKGEAYNISSNGDMGNYASVDEIGDAILKITSGPDERVQFKDGGNNARKPGIRLNNNKLKGLGWSVTTSLEDGIKKTIESIESRGAK